MNLPQTTVILAMTADGKIADIKRSPARFASATDKAHLEKQISLVDGVLLGAGTLRAYGTTLPISNPHLLQGRKQQNKPPQPVQIVCSRRAEIDPQLRFFRQPVPRWLLTTTYGAKNWQEKDGFEQILIADSEEISIKEKRARKNIDWIKAFEQLTQLNFKKIAILGGGELVASLLANDLIDELWLTICPVILGGVNSPTPVEGIGFLSKQVKKLELLSVETIEQEIFLHYRLKNKVH